MVTLASFPPALCQSPPYLTSPPPHTHTHTLSHCSSSADCCLNVVSAYSSTHRHMLPGVLTNRLGLLWHPAPEGRHSHPQPPRSSSSSSRRHPRPRPPLRSHSRRPDRRDTRPHRQRQHCRRGINTRGTGSCPRWRYPRPWGWPGGAWCHPHAHAYQGPTGAERPCSRWGVQRRGDCESEGA